MYTHELLLGHKVYKVHTTTNIALISATFSVSPFSCNSITTQMQLLYTEYTVLRTMAFL